MKLKELLEEIIASNSSGNPLKKEIEVILKNPSVREISDLLKDAIKLKPIIKIKNDENFLRFLYLPQKKELYAIHAYSLPHLHLKSLLISKKIINEIDVLFHGYLTNKYYNFWIPHYEKNKPSGVLSSTKVEKYREETKKYFKDKYKSLTLNEKFGF